MTTATIKFHIDTIAKFTAEMETAEAAGDQMTAGMIWDAIVYRKKLLASLGVVII